MLSLSARSALAVFGSVLLASPAVIMASPVTPPVLPPNLAAISPVTPPVLPPNLAAISPVTPPVLPPNFC